MRISYLSVCASSLWVLAVSCAVPEAPPSTTSTSQPLYLPDLGGPDVLAAGDNDDWHGSHCSYAGLCRLVGDVSGSTITGLDQAVFGDHDVGLQFRNDGSTPIRFAHAHAGSSTNNRIHARTGEDVVVAPHYGIAFRADVDWSTDPFTPLGWGQVTDNAVDSVTHTTPSRSLGTAFRPSLGRPVMACYSVQISVTVTLAGGQAGRVELLSDAANPPTTVRASVPGGLTGTVVVGVSLTSPSGGTVCALVKPGDYALLRSVDVVGTPSYAVLQQVEDVL